MFKMRTLALLLLMIMLSFELIGAVDIATRMSRLESLVGNLISSLMMDDAGGKVSDVKRQAVDTDMETTLNQLTIEDLRELIRGRDGRDGLPGLPGEDGEDGTPGAKGDAGELGAPGSTGTTGAKRETGAAGIPGVKGEPGTDGLAGDRIVTGSLYTRWGRKSCAGNSSLIYEGFAASAAYHSTGGGTNYQCLPLNPEQDSLHMPDTVARSVIAGTEYQSFSYGPFPSAAHDQNVPCARCYSPNSAVMMIPATTQCPPGWQREYHGYLMTTNTISHVHQATYECVDRYPEYVRGLQGDTDGAVFVFVVPDCDGMDTTGHCPPYNANKKLLCAVCTK